MELWFVPEEFTPETLMRKHASYPRNKNVAYVFFKAGFIESWGHGYKKIREELDRVGMPMPTVEEKNGEVLAVMKRFTMDEVIARRKDDITEPCREHVGNMSET